MPKLRPTHKRIAVKLYRLLAEGRPVPQSRLAEALHISERAVRGALSQLPFVFYDKRKEVIQFGGLTLRKTPHSFRVDSQTLYTWCAWDSLFVPAILGKTAYVVSTDPTTLQKISLVVSPERVLQVNPVSTVVSFLAPDKGFDAYVIQSFCHFVHFFGSRESGNQWSTKHEGTVLLSVDEAFDLGRLINNRTFGKALQEQKERRTACLSTEKFP